MASSFLKAGQRLKRSAAFLLNSGGTRDCDCPICGFRGRFASYGHPPRYNAECGRCASLERHRLLHLVLANLTLPAPQSSVLHFAPEATLEAHLRRQPLLQYVTADYAPGRADRVLNIEQIDLPGETFDLVIANHVLEHVDDKAALRELKRVLKPGGRLIVQIPIIEGWDVTYENASMVSEQDRLVHFGQADHVRYYGRDFRDRVRDAGFELSEFTSSGEDTVKYALVPGERVFLALKP